MITADTGISICDMLDRRADQFERRQHTPHGTIGSVYLAVPTNISIPQNTQLPER